MTHLVSFTSGLQPTLQAIPLSGSPVVDNRHNSSLINVDKPCWAGQKEFESMTPNPSAPV